MSRMSTFPRRPPSEQLCDLHVYKVPLDLWRAPLNNILNQSVTETVSLGIIRVAPDLPLVDLRTEIEKQLEELAPKEYVFLRSVGRSITRVKPRQEYEWTAKHFLPPKHYAPELYLLEATPELRDALAISERSSQLSPVSVPRASPGGRSYREGYRYTYRQGYPDESRSYQRHGPDKTAPLHSYSPLPKIKPPPSPPPPHSRDGSPEGAFFTDIHRVPYSDLNGGEDSSPPAQARIKFQGEDREEPYGSHPQKSYRQAPQSSPRKAEAHGRHQPIGEFYTDGRSTDPSPPPLDQRSSPRSPSPPRKGDGGKTYRGVNGYDREAAYTNNTNEDSGVAGLSPDNQYKPRDRENYYRAANSKSRNRDDDEEKRRQQEQEERALRDRDRWANEQEQRRLREEQERQRREEEEEREKTRRKAEEEEEEERRRLREEEDRRRTEEEDRRREMDKRRLEEEEEERRAEERRRKEEEERRREEEDRLKDSSDEAVDRYPSPLPLRSSSADLDGQRDSESAQRERKEEQRKLLEELQEARERRQCTERDRDELVRKAKTLQSKTQNRRNLARDLWKKRYFEEKKKTPPMEDQTNRLREELDALHRRLMTALEGPKEKNVKMSDNHPSQKNNYKIQCARLQHDIDDLKRRVENAKMKLTAEMKLRHQANSEVRLLRGELTNEKIKVSQTRSQQFATLSPWMMAPTPVPSITHHSDGDTRSAAA